MSFMIERVGRQTGFIGETVRVPEESHADEKSNKSGWNGTDTKGHSVASGVYFYRMKAGAQSNTRKMILLK